MTTAARCFACAASIAVVIAATGLGPSQAAPVNPTSFPPGVGINANAYSLQFAGANREATAAAIALDSGLSQSQTGGYPFQGATPNADPVTLANLYGPKSCPKTLVLAADDTPADALSAAGLFGVAALKVTDTTGAAATFDTRSASLLLTESGREGATALNTTTSAAITRLVAACTGGIDGLVLGGANAVPDNVLNQFKAGLRKVARVAGADRADTARSIAVTVDISNGTGLPTVNTFGSPSTAHAPTTGGTSLAKALFLAEDQTGADALAVGAVSARLHVPILLTGANALPSATVDGLTTLAPKNIIVLGGPAAISDAVATAAGHAAGSGTAVTRIAGDTRYGTSVAIAEQLFNLYPDYHSGLGAAGYSDQLFGIARDEGSAAGANHAGWPDALASAYYLASLGNGTTAPARSAPAVSTSRANDGQGNESLTTLTPAACGSSGSKCFPFVPLLLTTGSALDSEVDAYLKAMYPAGGPYKTGINPGGTNDGGFAYVFGGSASVSAATSSAASKDLAGGTYDPATASDLAPALNPGQIFFTTDNLSPFTSGLPSGTTDTFVGAGAPTDAAKVCVMPTGSTGLAAIEAINDKLGVAKTNPVDYFGATSAYPRGQSMGSCTDLSTASPASGNSSAIFYGVSLSGNASATTFIDYAAAKTLNAAATAFPGSTSTGDVFAPIASGPSESETVNYQGITLDSATYKGTAVTSPMANITVTLTRAKGANGLDVVSWTGKLTVLRGTTVLFTAPVASGVANATPSSSATIAMPITLLGVYSAPGLGAIMLSVTPPLPPGSPPGGTRLAVSGNA